MKHSAKTKRTDLVRGIVWVCIVGISIVVIDFLNTIIWVGEREKSVEILVVDGFSGAPIADAHLEIGNIAVTGKKLTMSPFNRLDDGYRTETDSNGRALLQYRFNAAGTKSWLRDRSSVNFSGVGIAVDMGDERQNVFHLPEISGVWGAKGDKSPIRVTINLPSPVDEKQASPITR